MGRETLARTVQAILGLALLGIAIDWAFDHRLSWAWVAVLPMCWVIRRRSARAL
jgi:hypothetical protein